MKNRILFIFLFSLLLVSACQTDKKKGISGKIEGQNLDFILVADDLYSDEQDTVWVKDNHFFIQSAPDFVGYKYLSFGKNKKELFLEPGYSLELKINAKDTTANGIQITGNGSPENYTADSISKIIHLDFKKNSFFQAGTGIALVDSSFAVYQKKSEILLATNNLDPVFIDYQRASMRFALLTVKAQVGLQESITDPAFYSFINKEDLKLEKYMGLPDYRFFLDTYLNTTASGLCSEDPSDEQYLDALISVIEKFENKTIREYFLYNKMKLFLSTDAIQNKEKYKAYIIKNITNPDYSKRIQILLDK